MGTVAYCLLLVLMYIIPVTATTTVFHTNCTRPSPGSNFNFVTSANTRGTINILWSCLFTLLTCTWTVQHLNVPPKNISGPWEFFRKPTWMLLTLLAPEILLGIAFEDFDFARRSLREMKLKFPQQFSKDLVQQGGWTRTHGFYAAMGGIVLRERVALKSDLAESQEEEPTEIQLNSSQVIKCFELGVLPSPPKFITKRDIQHQAKGDIFLKCVAVFQVIWFIVQVCARKIQNLPISQLEIGVLAFCICTLTSYFLWFEKPQDGSVPTYLDAVRPLRPKEREAMEELKKPDYNPDLGFESSEKSSEPSEKVLGMSVQDWGIIMGSIIFGGIHILAWNLHFPTHIEKILWRITSIVTTTIIALTFYLVSLFTKGDTSAKVGTEAFILILLIPVYVICRVFIVLETLRSLGFLPASAFATTWSMYIPHV